VTASFDPWLLLLFVICYFFFFCQAQNAQDGHSIFFFLFLWPAPTLVFREAVLVKPQKRCEVGRICSKEGRGGWLYFGLSFASEALSDACFHRPKRCSKSACARSFNRLLAASKKKKIF
jgi:hypothetical protein